MFGVDIELPKEKSIHLFFGNDDQFNKINASNVYNNSLNALLIPTANDDSERILIHLPDINEASDVESDKNRATATRIIESNENATSEQLADGYEEDGLQSSEIDNKAHNEVIDLPLNLPVTIGKVVIALKNDSENWSDDVTNFCVPFNDNGSKDNSTPETITFKSKTYSSKVIICLAFVLIVILIAVIYFTPTKLVTLKDTLNPLNPSISQSNNGVVYILTKSNQESIWVSMALRKAGLLNNNISILAVPEEVAKMKKLLNENLTPFFDISFVDSFKARVLLSVERSPTDTNGLKNFDASLRALLTRHFPYLHSIDIARVSDKTVLANAIDRLKSSGLYGQENISKNHVTLNISGEIDDFQLSMLRRQLVEFYEQYGDQYVKFVVDMNEDPLRNRTFKTGINSYVVIPGNHWLYSDITSTPYKP